MRIPLGALHVYAQANHFCGTATFRRRIPIALAVATTFLINMGKARLAWITLLPMLFVGVTTISAGVLGIQNIFWPI